jgi:multiple sugar transport system substrate-binding protein
MKRKGEKKMHKSDRTRILFGLVVVASLILGACSPETVVVTQEVEKIVEQTVVVEVEKEVEVEKIVEVTPTPGPAKIYEGREINFMAGQPHQVAGRAIAEWFTEETGARVNVLVVPYPNMIEKATMDVTSGAGEYDVIQYWYPGLGSLVENGVLADITEWWDSNAEAFQVNDIVPAFLDNYTLYEGKRYGIPYDGDIHLMFYNTTIFDEYGVEPPETWDEYLEICQTITEGEAGSGTYGCGIMASKVPLILIGTFLNRVAGFGGSFMDADGNPVVNSPENVAALEHLIAEMPYAIPDPKAVGFDEMLGPWLTGRVGMVEFWTDLGQMTDNPEQSTIIGEWSVAPMPVQGEKGQVAAPMNAGWGIGLSSLTKDEEVAKAFMAFIMRPETNVRANTLVGGLDPMRISTFDDSRFREHVTDTLADAAKAAVLSNAVPWPHDAEWWEMQEILNENLALALTGDLSAQEALDDTQAAWEDILGQ